MPKRKITAEVSEVGQGVGIWVARTVVDRREWRWGRMMLARSCSERACATTSAKNVIPSADGLGSGAQRSRDAHLADVEHLREAVALTAEVVSRA